MRKESRSEAVSHWFGGNSEENLASASGDFDHGSGILRDDSKLLANLSLRLGTQVCGNHPGCIALELLKQRQFGGKHGRAEVAGILGRLGIPVGEC